MPPRPPPLRDPIGTLTILIQHVEYRQNFEIRTVAIPDLPLSHIYRTGRFAPVTSSLRSELCHVGYEFTIVLLCKHHIIESSRTMGVILH